MEETMRWQKKWLWIVLFGFAQRWMRKPWEIFVNG
jgi:hypothetical protein